MRYRTVGLILVLLMQGCLSTGQRIDRQAQAAGLTRSVIAGTSYQHIVYANGSPTSGEWQHRLVVYLDGDGRPWSADGQQPSTDPTTRDPIALRLLAGTAAPGIYVARPCYQQLLDERCSAATWTSERYSSATIASLAAAIRHASANDDAVQLVLVGYSGGGVLAVLVAEQLNNVAAVITIAANLDIDAWTRHHGYLPLTESLNPATSTHDHLWPEIHLQGGQDAVVPAATTDGYFLRYPQAERRTLHDYGHVCCWVQAWPSLFREVLQSKDGQE
ncbi:MAG TPA: hypothetical protein VIT67_01605 [Povalibacter sp.]